VTCDSGTIATWAARHWTIRGDRQFYLSGNLLTLSALLCLHWDQVVEACQGRDDGTAWRRRPLPRRYLAGVTAAVATLIAAPYAEELWRCAKARQPFPRP
jgi:hypothetical protein